MAFIYDSIDIVIGGETYTVTPSFKLIQEIERNRLSIASISYRVSNGETPFSLVAEVVSIMLQSIGVNKSAEEIWAEMFADGNAQNLLVTWRAIEGVFFPKSESQKDLKKSQD